MMKTEEKKSKHPGGRPTDLTPELQNKIILYIQGGNYIEVAAAGVGICSKTLYDWMRRGAREPSTIYGKFLQAIETANAEAEIASVLRITKAGQSGQWSADMCRLERKHPERWGRKQQVEMSGPGGGPIQSTIINIKVLSTEELLQLREIAEKAAAKQIGDGSEQDAEDAEFEDVEAASIIPNKIS